MSVPPTSDLYIGLMSGTSLDGVDGVLASCDANGRMDVLAHADVAIPAELRQTLLELNTPGDNEIDRMGRAALALADTYAGLVGVLLARSALSAGDVRAIGAHGQTIRHRPDIGYTVQLNAPARLAEATGIAVVADLRTRDMAAGGQGAPLVPAFHASLFGTDQSRVILNLGGIANVTLLESGKPVSGFDTGPANLLIDLWCARHTGQDYDADGAFAASGTCSQPLLDYLIGSEPWFAAAPPKSTGRDLFNAGWLSTRLATWQDDNGVLAPADVQATLQRLTARTVADAVAAYAATDAQVWVCGGGARNGGLVRDLEDCLNKQVFPTDLMGVPAQQVEALAFAWLAARHVQGRTANLPAVTGARGERILGAYYPA